MSRWHLAAFGERWTNKQFHNSKIYLTQKSMLCLIALLVLLNITCNETSNVGSAIFYNKRGTTECWSEEDIAKLQARKLFQDVMPPLIAPDKVNARFVKDALRYYRGALRIADQHSDTDPQTGTILKQALLDTIGGHLRYEMLPTIRFAYYAGYVPYRHAREIHDLLETSKFLLNTQGLGWKEPPKVPQWSNLTVVKVLIGSGKLYDPCAYLVMKRDSNSCIHLPSPRLDDSYAPSAIALPFKVNSLVSLTSPRSENVLLKYYTSATRCILRSSPQDCRHTDFVNFNNELWHWMKRDVAPHLMDEKLYAAYGGVLRIAAAVQGYGKGLSRRNLFQYVDSGEWKWHPWKALTQSYVNINADWSPSLYLAMVFVAAALICSLQICYNYTLGSGNPCRCGGRDKKTHTTEIAYANVETTFPSILPNHDSSDMDCTRQSISKLKSSHPSMTTQRVYDLNENTEKFMDIIMSEQSETDSQEISEEEELTAKERTEGSKIGEEGKPLKHSVKLPELHTPISQLKIEKKCREERSLSNTPSMYMTRTSSTSNSEETCLERRGSESLWTMTGSTSTERSCTSLGSQTASRRSRSARDLAWARRVLNRHSHSSIHSTTATEFDINSYTTPPSRR